MKPTRRPTKKPRPISHRPWAKREKQLRESEGDFSDYAAWLEWAGERDTNGVLDKLETFEMCHLYGLFADCADETAKGRKR